MLKANVEKVENGYLLHIYEQDKEVKTRTYIASDQYELSALIADNLDSKKKGKE